MISRIFLALVGLLFLAFGLWSITDPLGMTSQLGVDVSGISGTFEMRGIYGGVSLGAALLCLFGALRPAMTDAALWFVTAYMGGYVIGRGASLISGDTAMSSSWVFAAYEGLMLILAAALLYRRAK
ncbi:MAG: DUF4345 family protein [Henriciella sp.]|nr:DUF4345 family protein [Henriciella sp.]